MSLFTHNLEINTSEKINNLVFLLLKVEDSIYKNYFLDNIIFLLNTHFFYIYTLHFLIIFMLSNYLLILYLTNSIFSLKKLILKEILAVILLFLREVEKELFNLDDILLLLIISTILISWVFFIIFSPIYLLINIFSYILLIILFLVFFTVLTASSLLFDQGFLCLTFVRGVGSSLFFFIEFFYDIIAIFILFIRLIIQNLRFFFIFISFIELQEFISAIGYLFNMIIYLDNFMDTSLINTMKTPWLNILYFLTFIISVYYYIIHFWVLCFTNILSYFFLVYWLYIFLYTTFFIEKIEKFN